MKYPNSAKNLVLTRQVSTGISPYKANEGNCFLEMTMVIIPFTRIKSAAMQIHRK